MTANTEKKVGFWTYYMALNFVPNEGQRVQTGRSSWLLAISALFLIWGLTFLGGDAVPASLTFAVFTFGSVISLCDATRVRPSLFNVMPIGRTRKTGFFFLSIALTTVLATLAVVALLATGFLIVALIGLAASGEWLFALDASDALAMPCLQGELLALIFGAGVFGAGMIVACIKKKALQRFFALAAPVIAIAPFVVLMQLGRIEHGKLFLLFDTLPYSYVYLIVFGVIAVALLVVGVLRLIRFLEPKRK